MLNLTPIAWRRRWRREHARLAGEPLRRHEQLANCLIVAGCLDADAAAAVTSAAALYEEELQRCGGDAEAVGLRVRKLILAAALSSPKGK